MYSCTTNDRIVWIVVLLPVVVQFFIHTMGIIVEYLTRTKKPNTALADAGLGECRTWSWFNSSNRAESHQCCERVDHSRNPRAWTNISMYLSKYTTLGAHTSYLEAADGSMDPLINIMNTVLMHAVMEALFTGLGKHQRWFWFSSSHRSLNNARDKSMTSKESRHRWSLPWTKISFVWRAHCVLKGGSLNGSLRCHLTAADPASDSTLRLRPKQHAKLLRSPPRCRTLGS